MRPGQMINHSYGDFGTPVSTAATSALNYDTLGFDYAVVNVVHEAAPATNSSSQWTSLRLLHGTTTDATNFTAITGATGTTNTTTAAGEFLLPVHNDTVLGAVVAFYVQLVGKERYLRVEKQAGSTTAPSIITNGTFAADTDWTKGAGWTIGSGVATGVTASSDLEQALVIVQGVSYEVVYTVATATAGDVTVKIGGTAGTTRSTAATFTETIVAGSGSLIEFTGNGFSGTLDDVTVKAFLAFTTNHIMLFQADNVPSTAGTRGSNVDVFV